MDKKISAHGRTYSTIAAANARIAELSLENLINGLSDGRVTEINSILESMLDIADESLGHNTYKNVQGKTMSQLHVLTSLRLQSYGF